MLLPWLMMAFAVTGRTDDPAQAITKGTALYHSCQAEVRLMDLANLSAATQPDLIDGSFCVGFVNGFVANLHSDRTTICTNSAPVGTVIRAYVTFMDKNDKLLEEDRRVGLRLAMEEAYPCPVKDQPRGEDPSTAHTRTT